MSALVADTHAVLWYLNQPDRLSRPAEAALDDAQRAGDPIYVASVSLVETAYLVEKGRLLESAYERLIAELGRLDSGVVIVPLDLSIAQAVRRVPRSAVPELPDRIIAATALHLGLPLVTRDLAIQAAHLPTIW